MNFLTKCSFFKLFTILFLFLQVNGLGQVVFVGDELTKESIPGVLVLLDDQVVGNTDVEGRVELSNRNGDSLIFLHPGYESDTVLKVALVEIQFRVFLTPKDYLIAPVVISASRFGDSVQRVPFQIQSIDSKTLRAATTQNTADLMQEHGNVYVQKSQMGGGSPVLRGFEANRVLLVTDGVRMNNAIYRSGHLQNILTIDADAQQRVEVLFGPSSVIYGSDALGGVMHFHSLDGVFGHDSIRVLHGSALVKYNSANAGTNFHVHTQIGLKNLALVTSLSSASFGHLKSGARANPFKRFYWKQPDYVAVRNGKDTVLSNPDPLLQIGTRYAQRDFMQKASFYTGDLLKHTFFVNYSTSSDIPRYDRLVLRDDNGSPKYAVWEYGPQKRLFSYYKLQSWRKTPYADEAKVLLSYQRIEESRISRRFEEEWEAQRLERVNVLGVNVDVRKSLSAKSTIQYGTEAYFNDVNSTALEVSQLDGSERRIGTRYPDGGSNWNMGALYLKYLWNLKETIHLRTGVRYSLVDLNARIRDTTFYALPISRIDQTNQALSGSLGATWQNTAWMTLRAAFSTGFRAPNIDDVSKVFDSTPGNVVVPNADLKPEKVYTTELSAVMHDQKRFSIEVGGYYTLIHDLIQVGDFELNGQDSVMYDGQLSRVQANINLSAAQIYGAYFLVNYRPFSYLETNLSLTKTYGHDIHTKVPLAHIPPLYGKWSLIHKWKRAKLKQHLFVQFNGWKYARDFHPSGTDRLSYATPEGSPAWFTINYLLDKRLGEHVSVRFGVNNILDTHYRAFSTTVNGAGRHVIINLRADF